MRPNTSRTKRKKPSGLAQEKIQEDEVERFFTEEREFMDRCFRELEKLASFPSS